MIQLTQAHILGAIIAFLLGIFIVPIVIYYSDKMGLVDVPNERKIHKGKISRLGGVGIWFAVMLTFLFLVLLSYYPKGVGLSGIIVGGSLMFLLGLIDDIFCLNAKFKLFLQISIATIVILLGIRIDEIYNPINNTIIPLHFWAYPISLLWIVGITNAINFIDGIDGLAGSVVTIGSVAIAIISIVIAPSSPISALVAFILSGAMLAFLTFNYNPAKIFMGDSGALFAGFMLSTLSITGIMGNGNALMYLPFLILAVPILDVTYASLRRISKGKSPFIADSEHLHHKLLHHGFSQDLAVLTLSSVSLACAIVAIVVSGTFNKYIVGAIALVFILFLANAVSKTIKKNP